MEINEKLNLFIDVFYNESSMFDDSGSYSVRSALAAFAYDLGIIDDTNISQLVTCTVQFGVIPNLWPAPTAYGLLTPAKFYYEKKTILDYLNQIEPTSTQCKFSSDKEALAHNLARLNMVQDQFNQHIMMRAVLTLAKELGIISDETIYRVLRSHPKSYDYYFNLGYYRKGLGIEEPSTVAMETQSNEDLDHPLVN